MSRKAWGAVGPDEWTVCIGNPRSCTVHKLASDSEAPLCACGFVLHGSYFANYILDICRV